MVAMAHPAAILPWRVTGTRAVSPPRWSVEPLHVGARAVHTAVGVALFDDVGRYVGLIASRDGAAYFGPGADTVLLRRNDGI
jgi:hypothetical protein